MIEKRHDNSAVRVVKCAPLVLQEDMATAFHKEITGPLSQGNENSPVVGMTSSSRRQESFRESRGVTCGGALGQVRQRGVQLKLIDFTSLIDVDTFSMIGIIMIT